MCEASNVEAGFQAASKQIAQVLSCNTLPSQTAVKNNLSCPSERERENCGLGKVKNEEKCPTSLAIRKI